MPPARQKTVIDQLSIVLLLEKSLKEEVTLVVFCGCTNNFACEKV